MKSPPTFEIKVAVIGPVSAGKSTLLNALLVGKYSEVSIRRTTACVNFFRLNHELPGEDSPQAKPNVPNLSKLRVPTPKWMTPTALKWSMTPDQTENEDKILSTITKNNQSLRTKRDNKVSEKTFDILVDKPLCECRPDTKMVIVDVPGINEAESSSKYRDYIATNWKTYDCVILVMDSRQGVNTEEQIHVLEFVKNTMRSKKVPVIILFNKVDELDIQEELQIIQEARQKVNVMFDVPKNLRLMKKIMDGNWSFSEWNKSKPVFLPISARNGYVYRLAQTVDKERFKLLEKDLVEALGREQIGLRRWNKMSQSQKYDAAYEAISEEEVYQEGIESSNFQKFLSILDFCVGGERTQSLLIEEQIRVGLATFAHEAKIGKELTLLYDRAQVFPHLQALGAWIWRDFMATFWRQYELMSFKCNRVLGTSPLTSHKPIEELTMYYRLASKAGWQAEQRRTIEASLEYLNSYVQTVLDSLSSTSSAGKSQNVLGKTYDVAKLRELLEATTHVQFAKYPFQQARLAIEMGYHRAITRLCDCQLEVCCSCGKHLVDGTKHLHQEGSPEKCWVHASSSDRSLSCPMEGCDKANARTLRPHVAGNWHCYRCGKMFKYSPTEMKPVKLVYVSGGWNFRPGGFPSHWDAFNHQLSEPEHFGHPFWLFFEWMDSIAQAN